MMSNPIATERERLAEHLLAQVTEEQLAAVDQAWIDEAEKRFSAWKKENEVSCSSQSSQSDPSRSSPLKVLLDPEGNLEIR
jgi:hypothetical protein